MIHYDELIKAEKMGYFSDYETMLFARAKGKIKSVTGVLPLTFTSKGGTAADWVIYGNDDNGTEQMINRFRLGSLGNLTIYNDRACSNAILFGSDKISINVFANDLRFAVYELTQSQYEQYLNQDTASSLYDSGWKTSAYTVTPHENIVAIVIIVAYRTLAPITTDYILSNITAVKGSTAPDHYIPYQQGVGEQRVDGYYVPLTISQQGQTDKTVDIYIGDSPLTEGETVSKTSTGQNIELFEGESVVSTTLYNKPEMKIEYV